MYIENAKKRGKECVHAKVIELKDESQELGPCTSTSNASSSL